MLRNTFAQKIGGFSIKIGGFLAKIDGFLKISVVFHAKPSVFQSILFLNKPK